MEKASYELINKYLQKWEDTRADELLEEGEIATQMVPHHPKYFITSHGRVISLAHNKPRILKHYYGGSRNVSATGNRNRPRVVLSANGKPQNFYVHKLVEKYLTVDQFIIDPSSEVHCHHKNKNAPLEKLNHPTNLLTTNASIHEVLTAMEHQQGKRWELPSDEQAFKIMEQILKLPTGSAIFYEKINGKTGEVIEVSALPLSVKETTK
ncbi:MAG: hypothetical protein Q4F41_09415 [Eubacteriales bacterium]|nr:hypothetical protein [Eubacteriales bacterium]